METNKSLLKQAEQNIINTAREMNDMIKIIDAISHAGGRMFSQQNTINEDFVNGIGLLRKAFYEKYIKAISDAFMFVGVGGEKAAEYSREKFKEYFENDMQCIMVLLEKYGNVPHSYKSIDKENLYKEANKTIKKMKMRK